jgi:hypothetical protein
VTVGAVCGGLGLHQELPRVARRRPRRRRPVRARAHSFAAQLAGVRSNRARRARGGRSIRRAAPGAAIGARRRAQHRARLHQMAELANGACRAPPPSSGLPGCAPWDGGTGTDASRSARQRRPARPLCRLMQAAALAGAAASG